jgi:hypothetical protein
MDRRAVARAQEVWMMDRYNRASLEACREAVQRLQRENVQLRRAAYASGKLAERINQLLRQQKRTVRNGLQVSQD